MTCDAFNTVLQELLSLKDRYSTDMVRMSRTRADQDMEKRRIVRLGEKLHAAAKAVLEDKNEPNFMALKDVLKKTSDDFDAIPF